MAKIIEEQPPSEESSDKLSKIRAAQELLCGENSFLRIMLSDSSAVSAPIDEAFPTYIDDTKDLLEKAGAYTSAIRSIEVFKESIGDGSNARDLALPPASKEWAKNFIKNSLVKCLCNEQYMTQSLDMILEFQTILRDLGIADRSNDHERPLKLLRRLSEITTNEGYSDLFGPTYVDERRRKVILKSMLSILKRAQNVKTAADAKEVRLDMERCIKRMEDSPFSEIFKQLPDLYRIIEIADYKKTCTNPGKLWKWVTIQKRSRSLKKHVLTPTSDLFGLEPIWRVWLEPICIGCGSGDLVGGVEWILRLWSSWSASRISN